MATKVKPSRINITWVPSVWKVPVYVDDDTFQWWNGWWGWDMLYADFYFDTLTWASVDMVLSADYTPAANFTVNAPATMEDWQVYILRVTNSDPVYTMTLGTNIVNPHNVDLTLTPSAIDMFVFLAVWWELELQPELNWIAIVDALNSTSTTSALSANQWKVLNDKISDLFWLWKFLSLWDATTWLPTSFPLQTPYTYSTWDYFLVETVSSATPPVNYRPTWSSYTGTASSTTESEELEVWDVYIYDGSSWLLQSNHGKSVTFSNIAWDAMDNANLSWYLNMKAFYLSSTSDLTTAQAAFDWQNWGKTAIIVYNDKPYAFSFYNTAQMNFVCLLYREQLETNSKTSLVRDVITLSITWGTTVSSISANAWNNIIASVLKTDTDYTTPYTPQYNGSPATKKYVDDHSLPAVWTNWQVLTVVSWAAAWANATGGWITNDTTWTTTTVTAIRAWTEQEYNSLWSHSASTIYHIY